MYIYIYIFYSIPGRKKKNVTSSGVRCIYKKKDQPLLYEQGGSTKGKTKVLTLNKYMTMGPSGARCQE
jgi:hypothetical protein